MLGAISGAKPKSLLKEMTNFSQHVENVRSGRETKLEFHTSKTEFS